VAGWLLGIQFLPLVRQAKNMSNFKKIDKGLTKTKFSSGTWKIDNCIF